MNSNFTDKCYLFSIKLEALANNSFIRFTIPKFNIPVFTIFA